MLNVAKIKGQEKLATGKGFSRASRDEGKVPAVIYGKNKQNLMILLSEKEITAKIHEPGFMSHLMDIEINNSKHTVMPKAIQFHPVSDRVIHIDFIFVNEKDKIKVKIPVHYTNKDKCIGVKQGGVVNVLRHEIEVLCSAKEIPGSFEVDLTKLEIASSYHVSDIKLPKNVEFLDAVETTLVTISSNKATDEPTTDKTA
jgi:large subunit ribosomal protein L25